MSTWDEVAGFEHQARTPQFTRAEAEAWLRAGRRLTAEQHEKLLTEQGELWSPGGAHDDQ